MNDDDKCYYVYALVDPRDGLVFYIGKGKGARCYDHAKVWKRGYGSSNHKKNLRIAEIEAAGRTLRVLKMREGLSEGAALSLERRFIRAIRAQEGNALTNVSPGFMSEAARALHHTKLLMARRMPKRKWIAFRKRLDGRPPTAEQHALYDFVVAGLKTNYRKLKALVQKEAREMDMLRGRK